AGDDLALLCAAAERLFQRAALFVFAAAAQPAGDEPKDFAVIEWLGDDGERAALHRRDGGVERGIGRYHCDDDFGIELEEFFERAQAADAGHRNVEQDQIEGALLKLVESLFAVARKLDFV